ncbi:MAG: serine/threonine protein kinase [Myxococcaceae bacterium]|nr:serine/threonine protein kinase [Myxococcaceae bacterium]
MRTEDIVPSVSIPEVEAMGSSPRLTRPDPYLGTTIDGRYLVEKSIGEGGMGVVYKARHTVIDKKVAIKVLRGDMARDPEMTDRFLQEARAASAIGNPHIVDISDFGRLPDGCAYFVMEYLDGASLGAIMSQSRPMPVPRLVHIAKQIAQGLSAAHAAGIVHRDLKPDNVHVITHGTDKDFAKVLDFGIAKVGGEASRITRAGSVFGTPHYMSPEQAAGAPVDQRTDIYALGVILYEMASGKVPFDADNFMGILTQHMYKAPVPIRALVPQQDIPAGLDAMVLKCLSKKPDGRYTSMDDLVTDFELLEKGNMPRAVEEMMARSGGFNVPVDYFRNPGMPAPVPGMPPSYGRRSAAKLYWALGVGVSVLIASLLVIIVQAVSSSAHPKVKPEATGEIASARVAAATSTVTTPPVVTPPPTLVLVVVDPTDAKVMRNGAEIGTAPIALHLAEGEVAGLTITRPGFATQTVYVDAKEPKKLVKLVSLGGPRPVVKPVGTGTKPTTAPTVSPDGIVDPWAKPR